MAEQRLKLVDIEQVVRQKLGKKTKYLPAFLISYLKRLIHQDEVNEIILTAGDRTGVDFLESCMQQLDIHLVVEGEENLPQEGRYTFASNHPLGGLDGIALGYLLGKHYDGKVKIVVNDLLMNLQGLAPMCIPVNKTGRQAKHLSQLLQEGFASENQIMVFPAGICSRKIDGVIQDIPWTRTFITKSVETGRSIVPIHFEGRNSNFFYRVANFSKALGLKVNLAMLFLADELFKNKHQTFRVKIGRPIPVSTFDDSKKQTEWAAYVRGLVYKL